MKLCRCIDVCRLRRRLRFASVSSPSSSAHHFCRRLRIASVVVCASPLSSSAHRLRRRLCTSASSPISPYLRIASALSPIRPRHYKLAVYDDVVSKYCNLFNLIVENHRIVACIVLNLNGRNS
ncbi:hypothetical protein F2Q69_00007928 [Brassica cretica]|uniref:Uncharacterized protein n=1 Tax=Brassica cretica TaxID=69181 RepID=A0A8S9P2C2_BRACR|nr:hypothetical protein F2Q69_00007928 [Brassica cretica]